ncbi:hypothetical protein J6590_038826 [Homalodisca vitripennis]|nr:hypothetical protein J6590_038826 [Homalodisca vitripennis]
MMMQSAVFSGCGCLNSAFNVRCIAAGIYVRYGAAQPAADMEIGNYPMTHTAALLLALISYRTPTIPSGVDVATPTFSICAALSTVDISDLL